MNNNDLRVPPERLREKRPCPSSRPPRLALETYSNVHRGTGYNSMASTLLYERARNAVLNICGLDKGSRYTVVFCSPGPGGLSRSGRSPRPARRPVQP